MGSRRDTTRRWVWNVSLRGDVFVLCFLCSLLVGLLYRELVRVGYEAKCKIMVYRDPKLSLREDWPEFDISSHAQLAQSKTVRQRVVDRLQTQWQQLMGSRERMMLPVSAVTNQGYWGAPALTIRVRSSNAAYACEFLRTLMDEHKKAWRGIQMEADTVAADRLRDQQAKDLMASARQGELGRMAAVVEGHEKDYSTLYNRFHMTVSNELKAERFTVLEPVVVSRRRLDAREAREVIGVATFAGIVLGLIAGIATAPRERSKSKP